ncbi:hypothetical protein EGH21_21675 [Halomicroarcula sp. F13]|uniref:DUF7344 domain-containing protein n=1 Tax=Haloarcula rubra TaxID=2487747 RepID=A0AAW4PZX4_9EURY|nr:hypothetical protein [Halomicroarcula rubra]MBX0325634.1 hypothetical protein [Halomicroarcula rubra]
MTPPQTVDAADLQSLTVDEIHDLLSSRYRRYTLYSLSVFTPPVTLARVADYVTEWEFGVAVDDFPDKRLEVYMALYHDHLPHLVNAGAINYDQETDTLEPGSKAAELQFELDRLRDEELQEAHKQLFTGI